MAQTELQQSSSSQPGVWRNMQHEPEPGPQTGGGGGTQQPSSQTLPLGQSESRLHGLSGGRQEIVRVWSLQLPQGRPSAMPKPLQSPVPTKIAYCPGGRSALAEAIEPHAS